MRPNTATTGSGNTQTYPSGTLQWGRFGSDNNKLIEATVPLQHVSNNLTPQWGPGLMTQFAINLKLENPYVDIVFIPCAQGSTGFFSNSWNKGDFNYEDMVARTNQCLSENPTFKLKALLWHQGENDAGNANYENQFNQFNIDWRNDIIKADNQTRFICGGLLPSWVGSNPDRLAVQNFLANTPNRWSFSGYASSDGLVGHDDVHFNSNDSLILGSRYYTAYKNII